MSILCVVLGHWLMAAPYMDEGRLSLRNDMLQVAPWTQWLTWPLQVNASNGVIHTIDRVLIPANLTGA